jgi:hypothetical protein
MKKIELEEPPSGKKNDGIESNNTAWFRRDQRHNDYWVLLIRQPWMGFTCIPIINTYCNFKFLRNWKSRRV